MLDEKQSLLSQDVLGITLDKYLIPVMKQGGYEPLARCVLGTYMQENVDIDITSAPEKWIRAMGLELQRAFFLKRCWESISSDLGRRMW